MSEYDDNYLCVDDAGNVIPANEEASMAVAETFGDELVVHDGTDEWYLEGMRECEKLRARLDAFTQSEDHTSRDGDDADGNVSDDDDDSHDGMDTAFSREYSDNTGDDEWVFEYIAERRRTAKGRSHQENVYDDNGVLLATTASCFEYLCKWKWYRELTWEPRAVLEEMGLVSHVDAFDKRREQRMRPMNSRGGKRALSLPGTLESLMGPDFVSKVMTNMNQDGLHVSHYAAVGNDRLESRFIARWKESSTTHCPRFVFHGTRRPNFRPIAREGFVVPSANGRVKVENGSVYGVGIYAAKNCVYSTSFTDCEMMFVCLALIGPEYTTMSECGDICVFFDEGLIVPLWVVRYKMSSTAAVSTPVRVSLHELIDEHTAPNEPDVGDVGGGRGIVARDKAVVHAARPLTKKMIRQLPRGVKELYKRGVVAAKKKTS
ncbi:Hypothetical protein, putative [Bodo saltans]|uniref:Chromo domain-containing protein n=1 Tax=Bodo saltans TaxID=75058 RepID=A0A0S4JVJ7_BODSA|nr:Hypothetical protein, putative [Bodo saltans]|eukprot:CUG94422.1 Hypothetical protein, putative [Bodo saltans]